MADLAVVALGIDTSALKRGEVQATASLKNIEAEMARAETQAGKLGTELGKSGQSTAQGLNAMKSSATSATQALQAVGGPLGNLAGQFDNVSSQVAGLTDTFGLLGAGVAVGVGALVSAGAAMVKMSLDAANLADELADMAEGTGLTIDQVQKLKAAFGLAGEDIGSAERAFRNFQNILNQAQEGSKEAARTMKILGVDMKTAGKDAGEAFSDLITRLKDIRSTTQGAAATNEVLGKSVGDLTRVSESLERVLGASNEELERMGLKATPAAIDAANNLKGSVDRLNTAWETFKLNFSASTTGTLLTGFFNILDERLRKSRGLVDILREGVLLLGKIQSGQIVTDAAVAEIQGRVSGPKRSLGYTPPQSNVPALSGGGSRGQTQAEKEAAKEAEEAARALQKATDDAVASTKTLAKQIGDDLVNSMNALNLELRETTARAKKPFFLPIPGGEQEPLPSEVGANLKKAQQDYLGAFFDEFFGSISEDFAGQASRAAAEKEKARREQIDQAFASVFDDAVVSLLRGKTTFTGALIGTIDGVFTIFAEEFARSMRESFVDPLIRQLTDFLRDSLTELFGNFSGKGIGGFFTSLIKSVGGFFGGFFAQGGTLGAHQFGIVGERGPEFVFSGNAPMTISPTAQMAGGPVTMNFMIAPDASGNVSRRSQDQIADSVLRGLQQSQKLKGAR